MQFVFVGSRNMKNELQKLKDELNDLLIEMPINSQEALCLSREIDIQILEYYREQHNSQYNPYVLSE